MDGVVDRLARLRAGLDRAGRYVSDALGAGPAHRRRLAGIDTRIVVSGVRGKSTTTRWLHDAFDRRGYDTFAKITGNHPQVVYNGTVHDIEREEQVRLYENERVLDRFGDIDVAIFENQGIRQYTTRLVNEQFVKPHVVFLTNVREDHLDTLGSGRREIARSLARAVPRATPVVCGEQDETLRQYLAAELDRRDAPVTYVDVPADARSVPGAECVHGLNSVLSVLGKPPIPAERTAAYLDAFRPVWRELPSGRIYNAASVNDVQSTELVRRSLVEPTETTVEPLVSLRGDRRGRTASFIRYLSRLYDDGSIQQAHVVGESTGLVAANTPLPVHRYDTDRRSADAVLDAALAAGRPVLVMGNTVTDFMRSLVERIEARAGERPGADHRRDTVEGDG